MVQDLREQACWLALVFESGLPTRTINDILVAWCYQQRRSLQDFFAMGVQQWVDTMELGPDVIQKLERTRTKLAAQAFLVEQLSHASISLLTLFDEEYPKRLRSALKRD